LYLFPRSTRRTIATMDAHQVLGLPPNATLDDAEDAYRRLLRVHHPDLHQHEGPGPLAAAELRTASLNAAIDHFRRITKAAPVGSYERFDARAWDPAPMEDDHPLVACPLCDEWFATAPSLRAHVTGVHEMHLDGRRRRRALPRLTVPLVVFAPANTLLALLAGGVTDRMLGSSTVALWVMGLAMAPTAIRVLTSD
jgi:hypothetical protein